MTINTQMTQAEITKANNAVHAFNTKLKAKQKIVSKNKLGEADFLKLMITQLQNQDPTKPMDDKAFIAQMAQFSSLKQMGNLASSMTKFTKEFAFTKAVALVGKHVTWNDNTGALQQGVVESIHVKNGDAFLKVNGEDVYMKQINEVR